MKIHTVIHYIPEININSYLLYDVHQILISIMSGSRFVNEPFLELQEVNRSPIFGYEESPLLTLGVDLQCKSCTNSNYFRLGVVVYLTI